MCLRRGESEDRLERRNRAKGHLDIDLEEFDRRRSYFLLMENLLHGLPAQEAIMYSRFVS